MINTKIFLNFPRTAAETAGTASWLLVLYISALTFLGFFLIAKLYSRFEGKDLLDIGEHIGGSMGRSIIGVIIITFLIFITSVVLREFGEDMKIIALTVSPISFVSLFFISGMIIGAYMGLEAIVRFHTLAVPIIAAGYMIIIIAEFPNMDFTNILPILGNGAGEIFGKGFFRISIYSELLLLFLIVPFIKTHQNFKTVGYTAIGFSTLFLALGSLAFLAIIPYPTAIESFLPIYQLARMINLGRFFRRIESLFMLIWVASALLYLTSAFYFIVYVFKKIFRLEYYKPLIIPFAIIIFNLSLLPPNLISSVQIETVFFRNSSWIVTFGMTIIVLIIARLFKKKAKREDAEG